MKGGAIRRYPREEAYTDDFLLGEVTGSSSDERNNSTLKSYLKEGKGVTGGSDLVPFYWPPFLHKNGSGGMDFDMDT